jgi:uncharacterized membrane protein
MLIVFPLGLLATSVLFDLLHFATGDPSFATVAYWMIVAGVIGGLVAAPFGTIDWLAIPRGTRARRIGAMHGGGNVVVVLLFAASGWLRHTTPADPPTVAFVLSLLAFGIAGVTAWLGGELVARLGIGVDDNANVDAPSSLHGTEIAASTAHGPTIRP